MFQAPVYNNLVPGVPVAQDAPDVFTDSRFLHGRTDVSEISGPEDVPLHGLRAAGCEVLGTCSRSTAFITVDVLPPALNRPVYKIQGEQK